MNQIILDWLKTKKNYFYYDKQNDSFKNFQERFFNLLFSSRVHVDDLEASPSYIIEKRNGIINYIEEFPKHHKYTFNNFNVKRNEYVYDIVNMSEASKNFTTFDNVQNRAIVLTMLNELKHCHMTKNTFFQKNNKDTYKKIFFDINDKSSENFIKDIHDLLIVNDFPFDEFKSTYIDNINEEVNDLNEIGIFYPFVFNHDIFSMNYYLFEINHLRFQKINNSFFQIVKKFYDNYGVNSDKSKEIFTLRNYLLQPGFQYNKDFAYFNPLYSYENYKEQYQIFEKFTAQKKLNYQDLIFKLFEFLNEVTVSIVKFQHENLINDLKNSRSIDRQYSVRELAELQLKKLEQGEFQLDTFLYNLIRSILESFINQPKDFKFTKNTTIDDLGFKDYPDMIRSNAQMLLDNMLSSLNKDDTSNLKYIINYYKSKIIVDFDKFKLNKECKKTIEEMIIDIAFFYDKKEKKLSKPYNNVLKDIYNSYQKKDISKVVDFDFQENFIQKYKSEFDRYKPLKIKTEDGKEKYLMTY